MGGREWLIEEDLLLVLYAVAGVRYSTIMELFSLDNFSRTKPALSERVRALRKKENLGQSRSWDPAVTTAWFSRKLSKCRPRSRNIIVPTDEKQELVKESSPLRDSSFMANTKQAKLSNQLDLFKTYTRLTKPVSSETDDMAWIYDEIYDQEIDAYEFDMLLNGEAHPYFWDNGCVL